MGIAQTEGLKRESIRVSNMSGKDEVIIPENNCWKIVLEFCRRVGELLFCSTGILEHHWINSEHYTTPVCSLDRFQVFFFEKPFTEKFKPKVLYLLPVPCVLLTLLEQKEHILIIYQESRELDTTAVNSTNTKSKVSCWHRMLGSECNPCSHQLHLYCSLNAHVHRKSNIKMSSMEQVFHMMEVGVFAACLSTTALAY